MTKNTVSRAVFLNHGVATHLCVPSFFWYVSNNSEP